MKDPDCLFCQIVAGEFAAQRVFETPETVAFLDSRPVFKGHTLVVPRDHFGSFEDLPSGLMTSYFGTVQQLATAMREGLGAQGSFVATNNVVSQSVPHLHVHVVPRTKGDGLRGFFWPRTRYADDVEAASYAKRLAAVLPNPSGVSAT
ncbi:MAG: HIT family protein [Nocardioidaceae bacterium]